MIFLFLLQSKIVRVLNLWQKNGVFKIEVIQPLLDMAAGSSSSMGLDNGPDAGKTLMCNIVNIAMILTCFLFGMRFNLLYRLVLQLRVYESVLFYYFIVQCIYTFLYI